VEVQVVEEVLDRSQAWAWGVRAGMMAFMIHSGSRNVGKHIGGYWKDRAVSAWPKGLKFPPSRIFPISWRSDPDLANAYLQAEASAANYGFVNRLILAELLRQRLRSLLGEVEAPLVYDLPHNISLKEGDRWVARKGACPAHAGQPVIIPGSMGTSSYLLVGEGNERWLSSASHGAGRAVSRFEMGRIPREKLGLSGVECITLKEERRVEEAPAAYKPITSVIAAQVQQGTVRPVAKLKPVLTFKA
jgi:tRNA-splicing ligase RtcB